MKDPYEKAFNSIADALTKLSGMIVWMVKRTMSVKDYMDFMSEFTEKTDEKETVLSELMKEKQNETD